MNNKLINIQTAKLVKDKSVSLCAEDVFLLEDDGCMFTAKSISEITHIDYNKLQNILSRPSIVDLVEYFTNHNIVAYMTPIFTDGFVEYIPCILLLDGTTIMLESRHSEPSYAIEASLIEILTNHI